MILAGILLVAVSGGVSAYLITHGHNPEAPPAKGVNEINYDPPTKDEQAAGDEQKQANADKQAIIDSNQGKSQTAIVSITDASYYPHSGDVVEIRGFVSNIYEDGGVCTATLTSGTNTVTQTSAAFKDATTTLCGTIDIPRNKFVTGGDWQATLSYSSATVSGKSASHAVSVK